MTTIWERVGTALSGLGVPVAADVMISPSGTPLPDLYLAHFLVSSVPEQEADDDETLRSYRVQVSI